MRRASWIVVASLVAVGCGQGSLEKSPEQARAQPAAAASTGAFGAIESDIFRAKCTQSSGCHAGDTPAGSLDLSVGAAHGNLVGIKASRRPERLRVAPGDPENSYLLNRLVAGGDSPPMPLGGERLSAAEVETIRGWIRDGAKR